eukprot:GDKI01027455.1.p2 GENE.GDKI01027455.1~~GDKI01027455.1.p2  ORF type:complete len:106 (+),score=24.50 GDKI01027455.1:94-411(+)
MQGVHSFLQLGFISLYFLPVRVRVCVCLMHSLRMCGFVNVCVIGWAKIAAASMSRSLSLCVLCVCVHARVCASLLTGNACMSVVLFRRFLIFFVLSISVYFRLSD